MNDPVNRPRYRHLNANEQAYYDYQRRLQIREALLQGHVVPDVPQVLIPGNLNNRQRAVYRRYTLYYRRIYGDTTRDHIYSPTALQVFVGGRYRPITDRHRFSQYENDHINGIWLLVTHKRLNTKNGATKVRVYGYPHMDDWFHVPKRFSSRFFVIPGSSRVLLHNRTIIDFMQ